MAPTADRCPAAAIALAAFDDFGRRIRPTTAAPGNASPLKLPPSVGLLRRWEPQGMGESATDAADRRRLLHADSRDARSLHPSRGRTTICVLTIGAGRSSTSVSYTHLT